MSPIGPFHTDDVHNRQVVIAHPDLPADFVSRLETATMALEHLRAHCHQAGDQVQQVLGRCTGAVAHVVAESKGQATRALQDTMMLTGKDGTTTHGSFQEAATHLDTALPILSAHASTIQSLMGAYQELQANGFMVSPVEEETAQRQMNDLTTELGNFGLALQLVANKINTLTHSMPSACAVPGVVPWSSALPTFAPNAFDSSARDGQVNMARGSDGTSAHSVGATSEGEIYTLNEEGNWVRVPDSEREELMTVWELDAQGNWVEVRVPKRIMDQVNTLDAQGNWITLRAPRTDPPFDPTQPNNRFFSENQIEVLSGGNAIAQENPASCLAGTMRMVLNDEGIHVAENSAMDAAGVDPQRGGFLQNAPAALRSLSSQANYIYQPMKTLAQLKQAIAQTGKSAIVSLRTNKILGLAHFVVVDGISDDMVAIRDPATGVAYQVPLSVFKSVWGYDAVVALS